MFRFKSLSSPRNDTKNESVGYFFEKKKSNYETLKLTFTVNPSYYMKTNGIENPSTLSFLTKGERPWCPKERPEGSVQTSGVFSKLF